MSWPGMAAHGQLGLLLGVQAESTHGGEGVWRALYQHSGLSGERFSCCVLVTHAGSYWAER